MPALQQQHPVLRSSCVKTVSLMCSYRLAAGAKVLLSCSLHPFNSFLPFHQRQQEEIQIACLLSSLKRRAIDMYRGAPETTRWLMSKLPEGLQRQEHQHLTGKMFLMSLPSDVLLYITEFLRITSPKSLAQLSLVNEELHSLAQYSQHHHVTLRLSGYSDTDLQRKYRLIKSANLELAVRELTIINSPNTQQLKEASYLQRIETICGLLPKLAGLKYVHHYGSAISAAMRALLPPRVTLRTSYSRWFTPTESHIEDENLHALCGSVNLTALDVQITWADCHERQEAIRNFKKLLFDCPNLRCLKLYVQRPTGGIEEDLAPAARSIGFGFENGERLPALEQLDLLEYPFAPSPQGILATSEMEYWTKHFDWSRLKRLKTGEQNFAAQAAKYFAALEEVHSQTFCRLNTSPTFSKMFAAGCGKSGYPH